jgi:uncharacterized protein with ATP-grasp and redox domains
MRTYLDCVPCLIRQTLDSARSVTDDQSLQEQILRDVLHAVGDMNFSQSPPEMAQFIHRRIRQLTGETDPFRADKQRQNELAIALRSELLAPYRASRPDLELAVRMAIAGNVIDLGAKSALSEQEIRDEVRNSLTARLDADIEDFASAVKLAKNILYLTDNAGEVVFDQVLVDQLPLAKVTVAVRGAAIINDATAVDAETAGLSQQVEVIDNGSDAPGTILDDCSPEFLQRFHLADLIVAKGQGNYETLCDVAAPIFFLLRVKCDIIARDLEVPVGTMVMRRSRHFPACRC